MKNLLPRKIIKNMYNYEVYVKYEKMYNISLTLYHNKIWKNVKKRDVFKE